MARLVLPRERKVAKGKRGVKQEFNRLIQQVPRALELTETAFVAAVDFSRNSPHFRERDHPEPERIKGATDKEIHLSC